MAFLDFFSKKVIESGKGVVFDTFNSYWGKKVDDTQPAEDLLVRYKSSYLNFPIVHAQIETVVSHTVQEFYFDGPSEKKLIFPSKIMFSATYPLACFL